MDRRRFEAAHLKFAVLKITTAYGDVIKRENVKFDSDIANSLMAVTPVLYSAFMSRYAGTLAPSISVSKLSIL
jgi:hypothetical protein